MNFLKLSPTAVLSLFALAGCAADAEGDLAAGEDEVAARPSLELATSADAASVQAKLFQLLDVFKDDAELGIASATERGALTMTGSGETGVRGRAIRCESSDSSFRCVLRGFDITPDGGVLPRVVLPREGSKILAGKLFALLQKGEEKGGLGVDKIGGGPAPCCDRPRVVTYSISGAGSSLSCTLRTGGIASRRIATCELAKKETPEP